MKTNIELYWAMIQLACRKLAREGGCDFPPEEVLEIFRYYFDNL